MARFKLGLPVLFAGLLIPSLALAGSETMFSAAPAWWTDIEQAVGSDLFALIQKVVLSILLFVGGWIAARFVAWLTFKALSRTDIDDKIAAKLGFDPNVRPDGKPRQKDALERGVSKGVYYAAMLLVVVSVLQFAGLTQAAGPIQTLVDTVAGALPFVAKAGLILGGAYFLGLVLSKIVRTAIEKVKIDERLSTGEGAPDQVKMGEAAGRIAFWVVMFFGLAGAFDALHIEPISGPLHNALDRIVAYLPKLAVAAVLVLGGWYLGKLARHVVGNLLSAVGFDRLAGRIGIDKLLGKTTPSQAVGIVVMAFVVLQASIAALHELGLETLARPLTDMMSQFWTLLPALAVSVAIVAAAVLIGRLVRSFVAAFLKNLGFDKVLAKVGLGKFATRPELDDPSEIVGRVAELLIIAVALAQALANLGLDAWAGYVELGLAFMLEHVLVALVVVAVGMAIGNYVGDMVRARSGAKEGEISWAAEFARYGVMVLAFTMALDQLGVAENIVSIAFALAFGSLCLAAGLAFGLGGKDVASEIVRRRYKEASSSGGGLGGSSGSGLGGLRPPTASSTPKPPGQ